MPSELTPKQEAFCLHYIETGNASEAYRQAYAAENMKPESVNREAFQLLANPKIASRLDSLREFHLKRHIVTVDSITEELEEARRLAIQIEQPSAAVAASMGKAKIHGHITDKSQVSGQLTLTHEEVLEQLDAEPA